jgi:uncharacterized protein (DUF4415 family)
VLRSSPHGDSTLPPRRPSLKTSLRAIERAFADIAALADALSDRVRGAERAAVRSVGVTGQPRRKLKITPKRRAQLKLQGAYMGYMRQLGPRQQARVRAVKEKKGFEAATRGARRIIATR